MDGMVALELQLQLQYYEEGGTKNVGSWSLERNANVSHAEAYPGMAQVHGSLFGGTTAATATTTTTAIVYFNAQ